METEKMGAVMAGGIGIMMMLGVVAGLMSTTPTTTTPTAYTCPICEQVYYSRDDLYYHFISAHPAEPIDIIWE